MKTPEEMAIRYSDLREFADRRLDYKAKMLLEQGFLAGYQAAKDQLADADKVMCNTTMEEIKAVDTGEIAPITNLPTSAKWISVNERLPEEDTNVLAFINYMVESEPVKRVTSGAFRGGLWLTDHEILAHPLVSHWMPLPVPPKDEK